MDQFYSLPLDLIQSNRISTRFRSVLVWISGNYFINNSKVINTVVVLNSAVIKPLYIYAHYISLISSHPNL